MLKRCRIFDLSYTFFRVFQPLEVSLIPESGAIHTHSVNNNPGRTALIRVFGPCVVAMHFIRWTPAALVTLYAMLLPACEMAATDEDMR